MGAVKQQSNIIKMAAREEREGIIYDNPEKFYEFGDEIGSGKMATVKKVKSKTDGKEFAAKMIYFDDDTRFAIREFDLMKSGKLQHKGLVQLHEAYMVRKYLVLIMDLVDGKTLLDQFFRRHSATEDDVAFVISELCEILNFLHQQNIVHLDLRPTNIRFEGRDIKLLDYNSSRHLANKKAGAVVDVIGDTEFCAPEMLNFDPVLPASDMWSVAIITYIMLSGISPFFYEDEDQVLQCVQKVMWKGRDNDWPDAFDEISSEAKEFIKKNLVRSPESRMTAADACKHAWLSSDLMAKRKKE